MIENRGAISCAILAALMILTPQGNAQSQQSGMLPDDINPRSFSRLPPLSREDLDAEGRAAYDFVVGDGDQPMTGPAAVSMYSPKLAEAWHILNQYLRFQGELTPRQYEVAILAAAWEIEQTYEWSGHEPAAVRYGVPQDVIDTIKYDRPVRGLGHEDTLIIEAARELMREHELSSELYAAIVEHFGEQKAVELFSIMGNYVMVGIVLTAIDQRQPPGRPGLLPER